MNRVKEHVAIQSSEFWVKLVDMLQQNWALIDEGAESTARVFFVTDVSGVFDEMTFPSKNTAELSLKRNGFRLFTTEDKSFLRPPSPPYCRATHPNGPIYRPVGTGNLEKDRVTRLLQLLWFQP